MSGQILWRLEAHNIPADPAGLAADLSLYLRYAPLTTMLVQIQGVQRAYVYGAGCGGCLRERCEPGCTMQLLRRALRASSVGAKLAPAPYGLAQRPYTRLAAAFPGRKAQVLAGTMLEPWSEARLWLTWRMVGGRVVVGAALAVWADGPVPIGPLRMAGWAGCCLPKSMVNFERPGPLLRLPFGGPAHLEPYLLRSEHLRPRGQKIQGL